MCVLNCNVTNVVVEVSEGLFYIDENQLARKDILQIVKIKYAQTSMIIIAWEMHYYEPALLLLLVQKVCVCEDKFLHM